VAETEETPAPSFLFISERPCLDFVNTEIVDGGARIDLLASFEDVIEWSAAAGSITPQEARTLMTRWKGDREAERAFKQALELRSNLRTMVERLVDGRVHAAPQTIDTLNALLRTPVGHFELTRTKHGYDKQLRREFDSPAQLLVPIAESAADLLTSDDLTMLKKCQGPHCILFFYDTTKNHRRRWCSMTACGNRAKVAAHYRRSREADA
jgi:predicted RNA-binding Zn ribbon-like protein